MDTPLFDGELVHARRMIYTPSAFAKSNLVHLQEVGQLQARSPHASTRQGLASYLFFVVESGSGTLEYEGETRVLSAGGLCVSRLPPPLSPLYGRRPVAAAVGALLRPEYGSHLQKIP